MANRTIMDINKIIFSRTAPAKKVEIVKDLTEPELLSITPETITRMVKESGSKLYKGRDKRMRLDNTISNDWNAEFIGVSTCTRSLLAEIYLQYDNTDTDLSIPLVGFLGKGDFRGSIIRRDRYSNPRTHYFIFHEEEKSECIRELLLEYLNRKYKDKLS